MNKKLNHNMKFMYGIMALALVVLAVVIVFWLWCFPQGVPDRQLQNRYQVLLEDGFDGDSLQVTLNDSVLFDGIVPFVPYALEADYPEKEAVLMVGNYGSDEMEVFDMQAGAKPLKLKKDDAGVIQVCK